MSLRFFSSFIIKAKNPCIQCAHYIQYTYANPYDEIYDIYGSGERLGKCSLFGKENLVTGQTEYDDALICRINDSKCGTHGKFFELVVGNKT